MTIGTQVSAAGIEVDDVFYCTSDNGSSAYMPDKWRFTKRDDTKFKFTITAKTIIFGSSGYFPDGKLNIDVLDESQLMASGDAVGFDIGKQVFVLFDGRFNWSSTSVMFISMMVGECEKF